MTKEESEAADERRIGDIIAHANYHFCKRCREERDRRWNRSMFRRIWEAIRDD